TLLGDHPLYGTFLTGQQTQPADRPSTDPGERIDLRDAGGTRGKGRGGGARCRAPKTGLENRDRLLESIGHLTPRPKGDFESTPIKRLPGHAGPDAEAD